MPRCLPHHCVEDRGFLFVWQHVVCYLFPVLVSEWGHGSHYEDPVLYCLCSTCHSPPVALAARILPNSHLQWHGGLRGRRTWWAQVVGVLSVLEGSGGCDSHLRWIGDGGEQRGCLRSAGWLPRGPYLRLGRML